MLILRWVILHTHDVLAECKGHNLHKHLARSEAAVASFNAGHECKIIPRHGEDLSGHREKQRVDYTW